jgi:flagellar hook-associated protein 1 FlgK
LRGAIGQKFFSDPVATVTARTGNINDAELTATLVDAEALVASDYRVTYSGGNYRVTRLSDGYTFPPPEGVPRTFDGITLDIVDPAVPPADGDSFVIEPGRYVARNMNVAIRDTSLIAAAATTSAGSDNTGTGSVREITATDALDPNFRQPVTITFTSPTTFDVVGGGTGNPVGVAYTSGADITYNGWTVRISGVPAAGDTFEVTLDTGRTADNRNALELAQLQTANTLAGGTSTFQGAYGQLTGFIGNTTREMSIAAKAQEAIAERAVEAQQSVSGVNLDEEAANLMRYQQAYQASAKTIEVAIVLFDTILSLGN